MPEVGIVLPAVPPEAVVEIRTTFSSRPAAAACGERLVAGRLAACVQIDGPVASVYRWEGAVHTAEEFRCTAKTTAARAPDALAAILAGHEYQTPEVIVAAVFASPAYAAWVADSVGPADGQGA